MRFHFRIYERNIEYLNSDLRHKCKFEIGVKILQEHSINVTNNLTVRQ